MNNIKEFVIYSAALLAASANNPYFDNGSRLQYKRNINNSQVQRLKGFNTHQIVLHEFSVHGVVIKAKSKKDAIKIYNNRKNHNQ